MRLDRAQAEALLSGLRGCPVAVLGDLMLDEYLFGEVSRISPEAPVPIVRVQREKAVLGGGANVAANLKALGAEPLLIGTLQADAAGGRLTGLLEALGIGTGHLVHDPSRPTIIKTRVVGHQQQMLRIDREEAGPPDAAVMIARYPAPPEAWWKTPGYAMRVLYRQFELRQDIDALKKKRSPDVPLYERALKVHDGTKFLTGMAISFALFMVATTLFFLPVIKRFAFSD